ncbi:hypothetical protein V8D89_004352 [Ganoderma adspersum]
MFARLAALSTLAFAVLASAHAGHDVCNTGSLQCCNAVADSQSSQGGKILSLVDVAVGSVTGLVAVGCTPITAIVGVSISQSCTTHPVCCSDNSASGAVSLGCVPVAL